MFGLFKKKSTIDKLQQKYEKTMSDWHKLSQTNRSAADAKYQEAQRIVEQIEQLQNV